MNLGRKEKPSITETVVASVGRTYVTTGIDTVQRRFRIITMSQNILLKRYPSEILIYSLQVELLQKNILRNIFWGFGWDLFPPQKQTNLLYNSLEMSRSSLTQRE